MDWIRFEAIAMGAVLLVACGDDGGGGDTDGEVTSPTAGSTAPSSSSGTSDESGPSSGDETPTTDGDTTGSSDSSDDTTGPSLPSSVDVELVPQDGVSGMQRINFAVPLASGQLDDPTRVVVTHEGTEIPATPRGLAPRSDGSLRAVQIQFDLEISGPTTVTVALGGAAGSDAGPLVPVEDTLVVPDATQGPRVWAVLPAAWLTGSGIGGPLAPADAFADAPAAAWLSVCDYAEHDTESFLQLADDTGVWLFDRVTALGRGYAVTGDLVALRSMYREAGIYGLGTTGDGADVVIPVPGASEDVKYHYTQNLAMHYLLTGDDRFRDRAQDIADRMATLWTSPGYAGGADFWTERHAGFGLLAYVGAAMVVEDPAPYVALADEAVTAYLDVMATYPEGYDDPDARCFAHHADAHSEDFGYFGCSPWMSAIVADGLEQYAILRGGAEADAAREAIVKMGRIFAREGTDAEGRPLYWMGVGNDMDEPDEFDEHWGESAYVIAMAWHYAPADEPALREAADALVDGLAAFGSAPHMRSYNWQCRSAIATPFYLGYSS